MNPEDARAPEASGAGETESSAPAQREPEAEPPGSGGAGVQATLRGPDAAASDGAPASVGEPRALGASDGASPAGEGGAEASGSAEGGAHEEAHEHAHGTPSQLPLPGQPTFLLFGVVASASLLLDVITKGWAEVTLINRPTTPIVLIEDHLSLTLAYNPGGAWGLLTSQSEDIRKPFFVFVSVAAILFIVSLYGRLAPGQRALTWGLPLVLGGALGNLADRITRSQVIDFIDYRADWVRSMNEMIAKYMSSWSVTDHWPTFNVADIAICVGVGLMAIDMITSRRGAHPAPAKASPKPEIPPAEAAQPEGPRP